MQAPISILCPNGHLAYAQLEEESYRRGLTRKPDAICVDAGSCDIGPKPLGSGTAVSMERCQRHDLDLILAGSRELNVPMVVGSANDTGANSGVDKFVRILKESASERNLRGFKLASIRSTIDKDFVRRQMNSGKTVKGLDGFADLTPEILERTDNLVAVMGVEPMVQALQAGADVIVTSRTSDCCIFASVGLARGHEPGPSYYLGKLMECASFCAEPYMAKESILGTIRGQDVFVEALHSEQRCTPASLASHAMYERVDPLRETFAGGHIDMSNCRYEVHDAKTTLATGVAYVKAPRYCVKLEGAGRTGEQAFSFVGVRDPETIRNIDRALAWSREKVQAMYGARGKWMNLFFHVYGRNGVMGRWERPVPIQGHELGIAVEAVAPTQQEACEIATMAARGIFYARLNTKGTAGGAAILTEQALAAGPVYEWTMNHVMEIDSPTEYFPITYEEIR